MPIYLFWGEDDFACYQAVAKLRDRVVHPDWLQFNYDQLAGDREEVILEGLTQAITPVFGMGERLVWIANTNIFQQCSEDLLTELQRTLPIIPATSHLLFTSHKKPDGRLKSTKLIRKYAQEKEFSLIPFWQENQLKHKVSHTAKEIGVKLTEKAINLLAQSVGNNSRQLWNELTKLSLYPLQENQLIDADIVANLVVCNTQNSLDLAKAIVAGNSHQALGLINNLINLNEPPLKIVAILVGQFRTWTIVKLMSEARVTDEAIASAAEIANPSRIYFIRQEISSFSGQKLLATLPLLLELEYSLKSGADPLSTLQTKIIQLCHLINSHQ